MEDRRVERLAGTEVLDDRQRFKVCWTCEIGYNRKVEGKWKNC